MDQQHLLTYFSGIVYLTIMTSLVQSFTDPLDVTALNNLYSTLNYPPELKGWSKDGGDPCEESWIGVFCLGSSVIKLKLNGLNLTGNLGDQLYNLHNLKELDVSSNIILGAIPFGLPPNATHINMASNFLSQNLPHTIANLKWLRHLNLSHNFLSGPIGNVFTGLQNLVEMDLSNNDFTGDLPSSFGSLTSINRLFLQKNKFTGSVVYLSDLPLTDLNIKDNYFSGTIPDHFKTIPNLWIGGNRFHVQHHSPPWDFPLETQTAPLGRNSSAPPLAESIAIKNCSSQNMMRTMWKWLGSSGIAVLVGGGTLVAIFAALFIAICKKQICAKRRSLKKSSMLPYSLPVSATEVDGYSTVQEDSPEILPPSFPFMGGPRRTHLIRHARTENLFGRRSFIEKSRFPSRTKVYTAAELRSATNNYSEENLLREGSLGSVYKAGFPDGQVLAVKRVEMPVLSVTEEQQFLDVVCTASRLKHPNIVRLIGYSVDHGQHLLAYEYVRNLSLDNALQGEAHKPLSWSVRLRIALAVGEALDYLHNAFFPPFAHCNLKAANILLDEELMPRICDCGLSVLRPLASNRVKIKASEIAIGDSCYLAPEYGHPGIDHTKSDVYAFGVLLLELITGRKPDDLRPWDEKCRGKWSSFRLHFSKNLEQMVDPSIKGTVPNKVLSRFADVICLCLQPVMERRPPMFAIVGSLTSIHRKMKMKKCAAAEGYKEGDTFERSFHTTHTGFTSSSPAHSSSSI